MAVILFVCTSSPAMNVNLFTHDAEEEKNIVANTAPLQLRKIGSRIIYLEAQQRTEAQNHELENLKQQYKQLAAKAKPISTHKSEAE